MKLLPSFTYHTALFAYQPGLPPYFSEPQDDPWSGDGYSPELSICFAPVVFVAMTLLIDRFLPLQDWGMGPKDAEQTQTILVLISTGLVILGIYLWSGGSV